MRYPLYQFQFCPVRGVEAFAEHDEKTKKYMAYDFVHYFNLSSVVACSIENAKGELLLIRRGKGLAKGTLDLSGGFIGMFESGEEAVRREVREEMGLHIQNYRYLFSLPNLYMYSGFKVYALGMFYECLVDGFNNVHVEDGAAEIMVLRLEDVDPEDFGLDPIRKAASAYLRG